MAITHRQQFSERQQPCADGEVILISGQRLERSFERAFRETVMKGIVASLVFDSWSEPIPELRASVL